MGAAQVPDKYLTIFIAIAFVLSLSYYTGYLYGLGLMPASTPLSITDIMNGTLTFLPISILILLFIFLFCQVDAENPHQSKIEISEKKIDNRASKCLFFIFCLILLGNAIFGTRWWSYTLGLMLFLAAIHSLNIPFSTSRFNTFLIKLIVAILAIFFSIGFQNGSSKFYSKEENTVILTNNVTIRGAILSYLSAGLLIKQSDKILLINSANVRSIEYQPSLSYIEAKKKRS